ncbi:MAG: hypothetical protein ACOYL6_11830 [Bacteriovoracaceae bacterium]
MSKYISSKIIFLLVLFISTQSFSQLRSTEDVKNKEIFRNLNFSFGGLGMHISPGLVGFVMARNQISKKLKPKGLSTLEKRWGIHDDNGEMVGVFNEKYKKFEIGALGCVACHSGKAAGQFYVGLGNKNIDVGLLGRDTHNIELLWKAAPELGSEEDKKEYRRIETAALNFSKDLADEQFTNLTQGLVPTSMIRKWFYRQAGKAIPVDMPRAAVKIPALYGYKEKRKVGQFCDGGGEGKLPGWGIAVELAAGQTAANVKQFVDKIAHAEDVIGDFLPPKYPFAIDKKLAEKGQVIFSQTCLKCHGAHEMDADGLPIYTSPKLISWKVVKTDHDRLDQIEGEFLELVAMNPLKEIIQTADNDHNSYFAPKLFGIWARFPYLHNASIPNMYSLLSNPDQRPKAFSLKAAGEKHRFDPVKLGLTSPESGSREEKRLMQKGARGNRYIYDVRRQGQSNQGHEFFLDLAHDEKMSVIEYLKTL